jgi:hypothetical protein
MILILSIILILLVTSPNQAYADDLCNKQLLTQQEWSSLLTKPSSEIGGQILNKLNGYRDLIGNCALNIVHTNDNVKYQQTEPISVAPRNGGGFIYAIVIHWYRDLLAGVIGKNLTTKITWEIFENKHYQAKVVEDSSIFAPGQPEELDNFFNKLLPEKIKTSF